MFRTSPQLSFFNTHAIGALIGKHSRIPQRILTVGKMDSRGTPRRFAPLGHTSTSVNTEVEAPKLQGVVFDVDGTLWYVSSSFVILFVYLVVLLNCVLLRTGF